MISFPHAKLNLGLSIVSKRPDGFHNIETIFYPIPFRDAVEIVPSAVTRLFVSGLEIPGKKEDNLLLRAFELLKNKYPEIKPLEIHLHKAIPLGAGLGGGSSDAAGIIHLINRYFDLKIPMDELTGIALELGSDCPFFIQSKPCFASGRGEILEPINLDLSKYSFLLIHPGIRIDTGWAFSLIRPAISKYDLKKTILTPVQYWRNNILNDFESPVFETYPNLKSIKQKLYDAGAQYVSMTGSGSTIFGIFNKSAIPEIIIENAGQTLIR